MEAPNDGITKSIDLLMYGIETQTLTFAKKILADSGEEVWDVIVPIQHPITNDQSIWTVARLLPQTLKKAPPDEPAVIPTPSAVD